jgi:endonuclease/exonuclease/phosphatase family metal-dependent hydrolase/glycosyltransferase involved in cell wall biosynthesis
MMTNTYLPHVGGVARSVEAFAREYRRRGHRVLIIAPEFPDTPKYEQDVLRVPAIQNFNGTDFSVRLPIPGILHGALSEFRPDIVHAHHPFLLGDTAQRVSAQLDIPLVFTHHTMYERYTHYVPGDSPAIQRFVIDLATHYANLGNHVFAPSESIAAVLKQRGVRSPIEPLPTGVDVERFAVGNGHSIRKEFSMPLSAFVVGHLGRLAPEKNLPFLAKSVSSFLRRHRDAHLLVVGSGPSEQEIADLCQKRSVRDRLHLAGVRQGQGLVDAYHAMNVFASASTSETQGMVLTEAMAAGVPVVAVDAPGAREVVVDRVNGRLLPVQDERSFEAALSWIANHDHPTVIRERARETAANYSMSQCADRALEIYEGLIADARSSEAGISSQDVKPWESTLRLIDAEYQLWSNRGAAIATAIQGNYFAKMPIVRWMKHYLRRIRRAISRNEWAARLLKLPRSEGTEVEPGLVLIQIDGLSRNQFESAVAKGRLRFLSRLINQEGYHTHSMYSGLPSSTPAVQGELFYGVRGAVPAFSFRDHRTGEQVRMYDPGPAADVQSRLASAGSGLLQGGSSYSNVYSGGADEARFCAATLGWGDFLRAANPFALLAFCLFHTVSFVRIAVLLAVEVGLALLDFFRGLIAGRDLWKELKFIPTRVGICVLMRELNAIGASVDVTRGLPIVHVNFLGYDEQAHRRGPTSAFAHWSLKGIDQAIRRIWDAAHRSPRRDYLVWVYSDHGQEEVVPYSQLAGKSIQDAAEAVVDTSASDPVPRWRQSPVTASDGIEHQRIHWLGTKRAKHLKTGDAKSERPDEIVQPSVTAMGPIAHVYLGRLAGEPDEHQRESIARRLVTEEKVPVALVVTREGVVAWTNIGRLLLPEDRHVLLGQSHPFLDEVTDDLIALSQHLDAGDVVLCGWRSGHRPVSFPTENGAHAGPGPEETHAFVLLPSETSIRLGTGHLRPLDLRQLAFDVLHPSNLVTEPRVRVRDTSLQHDRRQDVEQSNILRASTLRVLTYNVHSCIGMDGRMSPKRIARLIARCRPDIVAVQEVDVGRSQSQGLDQAHMIARELDMDYHFHPAWKVEEEQYGNAILSRFPMELVDVTKLPQPNGRKSEARGAMCVEVQVDGLQRVRLINTHLGLSSHERVMQVDKLLEQRWLGSGTDDPPLLLCGDFNMLPRSPAYRRLSRHFRDAQVVLNGHRPSATWSSSFPLGRVDHVFVSDHFDVVAVEIRRSQLARVASDHLPLLVELRLRVSATVADVLSTEAKISSKVDS